MSRHFAALIALLFIFSVVGCSTTTSTEINTPKQTCANSSVLIADLTKQHPLSNTQLPNGRSCAGENV